MIVIHALAVWGAVNLLWMAYVWGERRGWTCAFTGHDRLRLDDVDAWICKRCGKCHHWPWTS